LFWKSSFDTLRESCLFSVHALLGIFSRSFCYTISSGAKLSLFWDGDAVSLNMCFGKPKRNLKRVRISGVLSSTSSN
jgi:hypothetical protein